MVCLHMLLEYVLLLNVITDIALEALSFATSLFDVRNLRHTRVMVKLDSLTRCIAARPLSSCQTRASMKFLEMHNKTHFESLVVACKDASRGIAVGRWPTLPCKELTVGARRQQHNR